MTGRKLRFALATTFYPPFNFGGDGIAVQHLARALVRQGHAVTVVHDTDAFRAKGGRVHGGDPQADDGVRVIRIGTRRPTLSSLITQQLGAPGLKATQLRKALQGPFDVVHFHNISLLGGPALLRLGSGVKLYTAHEHWLVCPTHVLWRDGREPCESQRCIRCSIRQNRPPQLWRLGSKLHDAFGVVDAIIAQSEFSRAKHEAFGFRHPMHVLPPMLPAATPAGALSPALADVAGRPFVLFAGRLERPKGVDDLLALFSVPGSAGGADLAIVGDGTHGPSLRRAAAGNPRIRFLGQLSGADLAALSAHASALAVPSRGVETFGLVVVEGFRAGVPVVARNSGSFPELVQAAGTGALFDTIPDLDAALTRAVQDAEWRAAARRDGPAAFARLWSETPVLARYLALVDGLLDARTADAPAMSGGRTSAIPVSV